MVCGTLCPKDGHFITQVAGLEPAPLSVRSTTFYVLHIKCLLGLKSLMGQARIP